MPSGQFTTVGNHDRFPRQTHQGDGGRRDRSPRGVQSIVARAEWLPPLASSFDRDIVSDATVVTGIHHADDGLECNSHVDTNSTLRYDQFVQALRSYAGVEMRFGR